jgi:ABC-type glycerol-3-phosphate transport system substrate-binding protein
MIRRLSLVALLVVALASCGGSTPSASSPSSPSSTETMASTTTNASPADFGSSYIGTPTAFWFWAPY